MLMTFPGYKYEHPTSLQSQTLMYSTKMNKLLVCSVLLLLSALVNGHWSESNYCAEHKLQQRVESCFIEIYLVYGSSPADQVHFSDFTDEQRIDDMCNILENATSCTAGILTECHEQRVSDLVIQTLTDTFGFICGEGRQALIEEKRCWQNPTLLRYLAICERETKMAAARAKSLSDVCVILHDYKGCAQTKVTELCNENAGNFVGEMFDHATRASLSQLGCHANLVQARSVFQFLTRRHTQMK